MTTPHSTHKSLQKPTILTWRIGSYPRPKKRAAHVNQVLGAAKCPNILISNSNAKIEYCGLCGHRHPLLFVPPSRVHGQGQLLFDVGTPGIDPFRHRRAEDENPACRKIVHDSIVFGLPNMVPIESSAGVFPWVRTFLNFISFDDGHYYACIHAGMLHMLLIEKGLDGWRDMPRTLLEIKSKALKHLQHDIDMLVREGRCASDSLISTVYNMAQHKPNIEALKVQSPKYPTSPLANFQLLGSTGYMMPERPHLQAMYRLVAQRGGIHELKSPGVAHQLAVGDLVTATMAVCPPGFACLWPSWSVIDNGDIPLDSSTIRLSFTFGSGFINMPSTSCASIKSFLDLLPSIKEVTVAVDCFHRTGKSQIGGLVGFANSVHYRILCLGHSQQSLLRRSTIHNYDGVHVPTAPNPQLAVLLNPHSSDQQLPPSQTSSITAPKILLILRLAALIYSDLVIFPIAFASGIRFKLARRLYTLLASDSLYKTQPGLFPDSNFHLELWVLSMGYIACLPYSNTSKPGSWFCERLVYLVDAVCCQNTDGEGRQDTDNAKRDWEKYVSVVEGFLWWRPVMDEYARDLWRNIYWKAVTV